MSRIRTIKPEFYSSEQVVECSVCARFMFIGLWSFCDDAGRFPISLRQIKLLIFPGDDISSTTIRGMIQELSQNGLVELYLIEDKEYLQVTGWHHQRIDKPQPARYPDKTGSFSQPSKRSFQEHSKSVPRTFRTYARTRALDQLPISTTSDPHSTNVRGIGPALASPRPLERRASEPREVEAQRTEAEMAKVRASMADLAKELASANAAEGAKPNGQSAPIKAEVKVNIPKIKPRPSLKLSEGAKKMLQKPQRRSPDGV